ncbi:MAG: YihY/virulence factor BrkB family protein [Desulfarculaceae bacterium]|nr:YihY/virulence factor BrkB family protein [Desulfarculaceae bacterium]MCF8070951.1 YihY/virulence factor BrkB family protein [Desulfarculaceae bacterium]MCF8100539.1 YihY/virulence factor BrkB family protein [Desulfarculaceae bacterium]MCF8116565.1 YihY/virulence factor BrkB family protein [Desulfarculaceae bacterium]
MARKKEQDWFEQTDRNILAWLWKSDHPWAGWRHRLLGPFKVTYLALRNSYLDRLPFQANALTFITLLGLVPALAISFSLAKGLGFADALNNLLINEYTASQAKVLTYIITYVQQTKVGTLGMVGLALLVATLVLTLSSVEETFNRIWEAPHGRNWLRKFTDYLSVLVICPLLVLASTGLWAGLSSHSVVQWALEMAYVGPLAQFALKLGPLVLLVAAFIFLYLFLPNTRVPFSSALVAGVVAALLWWIVQSIYIKFQLGVARYNAIYGGFASLPLFMVWLQVSWQVLLFGAELAHAHNLVKRGTQPKAIATQLNPAQREALALGVMQKVAQSFAAGEDPWSVTRLAEVLRVPKGEVWSVVDDMESAGLVAELNLEDHVIPGRALERILVCHVLAAVRGSLDQGREGSQREDPALVELVGKVLAAEEKALGNMRLVDLAEIKPGGEAASCATGQPHSQETA